MGLKVMQDLHHQKVNSKFNLRVRLQIYVITLKPTLRLMDPHSESPNLTPPPQKKPKPSPRKAHNSNKSLTRSIKIAKTLYNRVFGP